MKKAAHAFLTAEKVLDIIGIVLFAILSLGLIIAGSVMMAVNSSFEDEKVISLFYVGVELLSSGFGLLFSIPVFIVALILTNIAKKALGTSKTRAEARKGAVCAIVAGAISNTFGIPAGVLMLCMKDAKYQEQSDEQPKDEVVG